MRHQPTGLEYNAVSHFKDSERLEYFLTRCFETDEVWLLADRSGLMVRDLNHEQTLPVWPYRKFAADAALHQFNDHAPTSVALDYFLDSTLNGVETQKLLIEIMPHGDQSGCLITPDRLRSILMGMIDAGEYRLDG